MTGLTIGFCILFVLGMAKQCEKRNASPFCAIVFLPPVLWGWVCILGLFGAYK